MTDSALPPSTSVGAAEVDAALAKERLATDPEQEPNAPNREHEQEFVRHDLRDEAALDPASDDDELDQPDERP